MNRRKLTSGFAAACLALVFRSRRENGPTQFLQLDSRENGGAKWGTQYQRKTPAGNRLKQSRPSTIYRPQTFGFVPPRFGANHGD
jgi:hypothetical protein